MNMYQQQPQMNNWQYMQQQQQMHQKPNAKKGGFAIASFVLGLCSLLLVCCCGISVITVILSVIFGIIALATGRAYKGLSISGLILSGLTIILTIWIVLMNMILLENMVQISEDYLYICENAEEIFEEYKDTGELPEFMEKYDEGEYKEWFDRYGSDIYDIMDVLLEQYEMGTFDEFMSESYDYDYDYDYDTDYDYDYDYDYYYDYEFS